MKFNDKITIPHRLTLALLNGRVFYLLLSLLLNLS